MYTVNRKVREDIRKLCAYEILLKESKMQI